MLFARICGATGLDAMGRNLRIDYWMHSERPRGALTERLRDLWRMGGHRLIRNVERTAWPLLTRTTAWIRQPVPLPHTSYLDRAAPDEHSITALRFMALPLLLRLADPHASVHPLASNFHR